MHRIIILCFLIIIGCSPEDDDNNSVSTVNYSLYEKYGDQGLIFTRSYSIENGKVVSETIYDSIPTIEFSFSEFEYDSQGRIVKQTTNGIVTRTVTWTGEKGEVYNSENQKMAEFIFSGENLIESKTEYTSNSGNVSYLKYNYDSDGNITIIEDESGPKYEYLDYDTSTHYPLYATRSMGILRMQNRPFFKNNFAAEKFYPFSGDDFFSSELIYDYTYTYYSDGKVKSIENPNSIYISQFSYD